MTRHKVLVHRKIGLTLKTSHRQKNRKFIKSHFMFYNRMIILILKMSFIKNTNTYNHKKQYTNVTKISAALCTTTYTTKVKNCTSN